MSCIFCSMVKGEIAPNKVYEDDHILAFYDIDPQAPVHVLCIPKKHISSLQEIGKEDGEIMGHLFSTLPKIAEKLPLAKGYRLVCNYGEDGGQLVPHLHFHLLGGRNLNWPPG